MMANADWQALRLEYITTKIGYRALAEKHEVQLRSLERHAKAEKWPEQRRQFVGKMSAAAQARAGANETERLLKLQKAGDRMCRQLEKLMAEADEQLYTHVAVEGTGKGKTKLVARKLDAVDDKKLLNISRAIEVMTRTVRNLYDIQTVGEREQLKIAKEELSIKRRAEKNKETRDTGSQKVEITIPDELKESIE